MRAGWLYGCLLLGIAGNAAAMDIAAVTELAKASGCFSCHAPKEKIVGPAYSAVAERYAGQKDAVEVLSQSIQMGSQGKWGRVAMPGHPNLRAEDIKLMAQWIVTLKP